VTCAKLVREYVALSQREEPFARIPHGRYINFVSDFVSDFLRGEKGATRERAARAWKELKKLDVPKEYGAWVKYRASGRR
jgi:hypothetical protein